jgi:hypothetical protein
LRQTDASGRRLDAAVDAAVDAAPDAARDAARDISSSSDASPDAAACDCTSDGNGVLHMSWACFCQNYGCPAGAAGPLQCTSAFTWIYACGLWGSYWSDDAAPLWSFVDGTGATVGVHWISDETSGEFGCSPGKGGGARELVAGQIPSPQCQSVACSCGADGSVSCPGVDGGPP